MKRLLAFVALVLASPGWARAPVPAGAHYVAMGSSFAAGPSVTTSADTPPNRCGRSADNYARQLARRLKLDLTDVSCGGATTAHLLVPWNELSPQLDALRADTRLVTVTIGGNDIGYIGGLMAASCNRESPSDLCKALAARRGSGPPPAEPDDAAWTALENSLAKIAAEVRRRSPQARLIFVDYLSILPPRGSCGAIPIEDAQAKRARAKADRLAALTKKAARKAGADLIRASRLSRNHDACAATPWMNGLVANAAPYHPNLAGMTAIADALEREIRKK